MVKPVAASLAARAEYNKNGFMCSLGVTVKTMRLLVPIIYARYNYWD